jgi:hypothetical protein
MEQIAQDTGSCTPNEEALIRHRVKSTVSGTIWQLERAALMMHAIHQKSERHLEYLLDFPWLGAQVKGRTNQRDHWRDLVARQREVVG